MYAGCYGKGVYKSVDGGFTWQPANSGLPLIEKEETRLAMPLNLPNANLIFAATARGLFKTEDGGSSWAKVGNISAIQEGYIESLALSPDYIQDRTLIVSVRGRGLFKSVDGAETFTPLASELINNNNSLSNLRDLPAVSEAIQFSPTYSKDRTIYGFSNTKIFKSEDGGDSWQEIKNPSNLPTPQDTEYNLTAAPKKQTKNPGQSLLPIASSIGRLAVAALASLLTYFSLGYLGLEKKLPLPQQKIKMAGAFVVFITVFMLSSILFK
jgi:hypothetical protein